MDTKQYKLIMGRVDHMMPHVPTQEMVENHPWHVYDSIGLCYTATRKECECWIAARIAERNA